MGGYIIYICYMYVLFMLRGFLFPPFIRIQIPSVASLLISISCCLGSKITSWDYR